LAAVTLQS
jgi:hypothetical protein